MKKIITGLLAVILLIVFIMQLDNITDKLAKLLSREPNVIVVKPNSYYKKFDFKYIQESEEFIPYSKKDLRNIFYSILNNGYENFTFYCPSEYAECLTDVNSFSSDSNILTHINNFISPFNNFEDLKVIYDESGEVKVKINKLYLQEEINEINNKIDSIINNEITSDMEIEDKILKIHDYIINTTKYDEERINGNIIYKSNKAYGALIENHAICGGYADAMALFLNRWNIPNFKVASSTHVWNAVYINDQWLHLDLTWDDPVSEDRSIDTLLHKFYLIDTKTLEEYEITDHEFNKTIYREIAN